MNSIKKVNVLVLGLAILLVIGCGGDEKIADPMPDNQNKGCVPVKSSVARPVTESDYSYNAAGQINRVSTSSQSGNAGYKLIGYNNKGQVYKIVIYQGSPSAVYQGYQLLTYTADSLLNKKVFYGPLVTSDTSTIQAREETAYEYDAQKRLVKTTRYPFGQPANVSQFSTYTYQSSNEILESVYGKSASDLYYTRLYQLSNHKGPGQNLAYFKLHESKAVLSDNILFGRLPDQIIEKQYQPGFSTPMNVVTFTYTYAFNPEGHPTAQTVSGQLGQQPFTNTWTYNCQ